MLAVNFATLYSGFRVLNQMTEIYDNCVSALTNTNVAIFYGFYKDLSPELS